MLAYYVILLPIVLFLFKLWIPVIGLTKLSAYESSKIHLPKGEGSVS